MERVRWAAVIFCLLLLGQIIRAVRREHIRVEYSMAWFASVLALLVVTLWDAALEWLTDFLGVPGFTEMLMLLAGLAFLFTFFRLTVEVSALKDHNIVVGQKVGMLEWEIRKLREELQRLRGKDPDAS
ncbi:MAG: DUF2304 family protein [Acidobacteria bacterium]|nr:DUF2304 family protein [Acidobacteriota bacterium]